MPSYIRLYADDDGESHFEDVVLAFEETDFAPPAPPVLISSFEPATQYAFELVEPGWHGDWHPAPGRTLAIYLSGEGEIEASDGEIRTIRRGTILLAEDTKGKGHISRVAGNEQMLVAILALSN